MCNFIEKLYHRPFESLDPTMVLEMIQGGHNAVKVVTGTMQSERVKNYFGSLVSDEELGLTKV